jgi:hypothetical protein
MIRIADEDRVSTGYLARELDCGDGFSRAR